MTFHGFTPLSVQLLPHVTYMRSTALALITLVSVACGGSGSSQSDNNDQDVVAEATPHWFYNGPLPVLDEPAVTVSLTGHTVRVSGFVPDGVKLPDDLPHVRLTDQDGRTHIDIVYPIATARPGKTNAPPGVYTFQSAKPYRPNGIAVTKAEGEHFVTWGGFPFIEYDQGIAFHGPITFEGADGNQDRDVWFLRRGQVSGGCNRMMGENVVELAAILGIDMRHVYKANQIIIPKTTARVTVMKDYDTFQGRLIDVDYPTDVGAVRPTGDVEMFGSWVATEAADGRDLPPPMKFEAGIPGKLYEFPNHVKKNWVCSVKPPDLALLGTFAAGRDLPLNLCEKKDCVLAALRDGTDAASACSL